MAVQNAARLLRMIAGRRAYAKDCDLGEPDRAATIRDAAAYAKSALERLEPALDRMVSALADEQRKAGGGCQNRQQDCASMLWCSARKQCLRTVGRVAK